ncbi:hypothetical protein RND71_022731 [Anisodus tanguticus]|uniref:Uncharacterized protein n=1 Tax=Anisodus tanguticus TaxID=243964 RepID=A0AAE1RSN0_9SOLA|nr:hypothetical protein RND71_022731 [Anisodus tanguticus]
MWGNNYLTFYQIHCVYLFCFWIQIVHYSFEPKIGAGRVDACGVETITGGCPNLAACVETCRPCYRGIGKVYSTCLKPDPSTGILYWRCRCEMTDGAPCPPRGEPHCPKDPPVVP